MDRVAAGMLFLRAAGFRPIRKLRGNAPRGV